MSFGFSAGDFISVVDLSWRAFRAVRDAPEKFGVLEADVSTLNVLLRTLQDDAENPNSLLNRRGASRREALLRMVATIEKQMEELRRLVEKYQSLSSAKKRVFDRFMFAPKALDKTRAAIVNHVLYINTFRQSISQESLSRIEKVLEDGVQVLREGRRAPSILSVHQKNDQSSWEALKKDLADEGIPYAEIEKHKAAIKDYIGFLIKTQNIAEDLSDDDDDDSAQWDSISARMGQMVVSEDDHEEPVTTGPDPKIAPGSSEAPLSAVEQAVALFDFEGQQKGDLSFKAGDIIEIILRTERQNAWWTGSLAGKQGQFPGNYVKLVPRSISSGLPSRLNETPKLGPGAEARQTGTPFLVLGLPGAVFQFVERVRRLPGGSWSALEDFGSWEAWTLAFNGLNFTFYHYPNRRDSASAMHPPVPFVGIVFVCNLLSHARPPPRPNGPRAPKPGTEMLQTLESFGQMCRSPSLPRRPIFLFLDRVQEFKHRIESGEEPLGNACFPDYQGGADTNRAAKYILWRFTSQHPKRELYPHLIESSDKECMAAVFPLVLEHASRTPASGPTV
ncbi:hypothetical protein AYL99_03329 [Fonsecaea erecta]|uniref:SH3 domain-containing protein n=1 Tax=Fonsecaea erecta TaxID=1367422 RepID=A0A178ZMT9_9EURO|nr:hypothetical protein AYL99_03329 [Fonsecaea erecta]OAP61128.1 hypothetical protein AYL99_03329 [Fonsecaea erecta]